MSVFLSRQRVNNMGKFSVIGGQLAFGNDALNWLFR